MKILAIFLFILSQNTWANFNADLQAFCTCQIDVDTTPGEMIYPQNHASCGDKVAKQYGLGSDTMLGLYQEALTDKDSVLCTRNKNAETMKRYDEYLAKHGKNSPQEVEVDIICGSEAVNKDKKGKVKECKEKLIDLVSSIDNSVRQGCSDNDQMNDSRRDVNKCERINSLRQLINVEKSNFLKEQCTKVKGCDLLTIKAKILATHTEDSSQCQTLKELSTDTSKRVCEDLFLNRILFATNDKQKLDLVSCLVTGMDARSCLEKNVGNKDDLTLLAQLKEKYCSGMKPKEQNACLDALIAESANELTIEELAECAKKYESFNEQQICKRHKLYEKLMGKDIRNEFSCWNTNEYKSIKKRQKCEDKWAAIQKKLKACEDQTDTDQRKLCFQTLANTDSESKKMVENYLFNKAAYLNKDSKACAGVNRLDCLFNLTNDTQLSGTDQKAMNNPQTAGSSTNTGGLDLGLEDLDNTPSMMDDGKSTNPSSLVAGGNTLSNLGSLGKDIDVGGSTGNTGAVAGAAIGIVGGAAGTVGGLMGGGNTGTAPAGAQNAMNYIQSSGTGFMGFSKDLQYMKIKKNPQDAKDPCNYLRKAAQIRGGGLVLGTITTLGAGAAGAARVAEGSKNGDGQKAGLEGAGIVLAGVGTSIGIRLGSNYYSNKLVNDGIVAYDTKVAAGETPQCTSSKNSAFLDNKHTFAKEKAIYISMLKQIQDAKNVEQAERLLNEFENYLTNANETYVASQSDLFHMKLDYVKSVANWTVSSLMDSIFPSAIAEEKGGGFNLQTAMSAVMMISTFKGLFGQGQAGITQDDIKKSEGSEIKLEDIKKSPEAPKVNAEVQTTDNKNTAVVQKMDPLLLLTDYKQVIGVDKDHFQKSLLNNNTAKQKLNENTAALGSLDNKGGDEKTKTNSTDK